MVDQYSPRAPGCFETVAALHSWIQAVTFSALLPIHPIKIASSLSLVKLCHILRWFICTTHVRIRDTTDSLLVHLTYNWVIKSTRLFGLYSPSCISGIWSCWLCHPWKSHHLPSTASSTACNACFSSYSCLFFLWALSVPQCSLLLVFSSLQLIPFTSVIDYCHIKPLVSPRYPTPAQLSTSPTFLSICSLHISTSIFLIFLFLIFYALVFCHGC